MDAAYRVGTIVRASDKNAGSSVTECNVRTEGHPLEHEVIVPEIDEVANAARRVHYFMDSRAANEFKGRNSRAEACGRRQTLYLGTDRVLAT